MVYFLIYGLLFGPPCIIVDVNFCEVRANLTRREGKIKYGELISASLLKIFLLQIYDHAVVENRAYVTDSGAGTNLKVGGNISVEKHLNFFSRAPPLFGSTSTISRFGERFRGGQHSLVSFLFAVLPLTVPPLRAQPFVKVGARAPPRAMESAPLEQQLLCDVVEMTPFLSQLKNTQIS